MTPMVIWWEAARSAGWQTFSEFIAAQLIPPHDTGATNSWSFSRKRAAKRLGWWRNAFPRSRETTPRSLLSPSVWGQRYSRDDGKTIDELLAAADRALYREKRSPNKQSISKSTSQSDE